MKTFKKPANCQKPSSRRHGDVVQAVSTLVCPVVISTLLTLCLTGSPSAVNGAALLFVQEPMIVSLSKVSGPCLDGSSNVMADQSNWTSSAGACDRVECHVEPSGNYTVTHTCRPREPSENPDDVNCAWVSNSSRTYPDCCPELQCGVAATFTTIDPLSCYDLATNYACGIWNNLTSGCSDGSVDVYNISQTFCRQTCGIC